MIDMSKIDVSIDGAAVVPLMPPPARDFRENLLAMLGLCFVLIMVALDQTIIATALPTVVAELHGFDLYAWVGTSYLLTSVIAVPIFGKLGDEHGRKRFVVAAIVVFTLASMLCGMAQSMMQLVLARGLQGVGGGMLVATAFACIPDLFPDSRQRLKWQVMFSTSFGLANAIGPSLGGFLTQYWGWRWVFFVNLPVGLLGVVFVARYLPLIRHSEAPPARMDWWGAALIALCLGSLQLFVEYLPLHKPLTLMVLVAAVGLASGAALVWWERRCPSPVIPLGMFTHARIGPLFALSLLTGFCLFAVMYYTPLLFQGGFGLSPKEAGLLITPFAVFITVGSIANGRLITRLERPTVMLYAGLLMFGLMAVALATTTPSTPKARIMGAMMLGGAGIGLLLPNLTLFTQRIAPRPQLGVATAMLQSMRMVGGMLGMALVGTFVTHRYASGVDTMMHARGADAWRSWLEEPQILVDAALAGRFASAVSPVGLDPQALLAAARTSFIDSVHISQWLVAAVILLGFVVLHRMPPIRRSAAMSGQAGQPSPNLTVSTHGEGGHGRP
jgi:EmrB/QacA subfamily drug resistance transporter